MQNQKLMWACFALLASNTLASERNQEFEIEFSNGDVHLAGTVTVPPGAGPHPGMVLVGGSGPSDRTHLVDVARGFAREGLAVLAYDKRGTGKSSGSWVNSALCDLAGDAAAAFHTLAEQPLVDPDQTGYWGISQGGWVVPIAVKRTPAAFAIIVSGGGLSPKAVETHRYLSIVEGVDSSPKASKEIQRLLDNYFAYLAGERPRELLMQSVQQLQDRAWLPATAIERVIPSEGNRDNWAWVATFSPGPSIASMELPTLVLLGEADPLTPAEPTARAWRTALPEGAAESDVIVVPGAGHGLRTGAHGGPLVAEFFPIQLEWLAVAGILSPREYLGSE